jgi:hypothetical protein
MPVLKIIFRTSLAAHSGESQDAHERLPLPFALPFVTPIVTFVNLG